MTVVVVLVLMFGIFVGGCSSNLMATLGHGRHEWRKMEWLWYLIYIITMVINNGGGNERKGWCETRTG